MRHAQLFLWALLLSVLFLSHGFLAKSHAQVLSAADSLVIVDANQMVVGPVFGDGGGQIGVRANVVFQVDPFVVSLLVMKNEVEGVFRALWESPDCTGNPVIDAGDSLGIPLDTQLFSPVTVPPAITPGKPLGKVYVADPNDTPHTVTVHSIARNPTGCQMGVNQDYLVVNTIEILDLDSLFTPPFHVEVREGQGIGSIQDQIEALETQVDALSEENALLLQKLRRLRKGLKNHSHDYLTGRGRGHNSTVVETSTANVP